LIVLSIDISAQKQEYGTILYMLDATQINRSVEYVFKNKTVKLQRFIITHESLLVSSP